MTNTFQKLSPELEQQIEKNRALNAEKYGEKENDVISEAYGYGKREGDIYTIMNARKYLKRYLTTSYKGNNPKDLIKAVDYILRALEKNDNKGAQEVIN